MDRGKLLEYIRLLIQAMIAVALFWIGAILDREPIRCDDAPAPPSAISQTPDTK